MKMSVVVKGMEMPEKCGLCDLFHAESPMHCTVVKGHKTVGAPYGMPRPEWCPLVALPDKHGDLIDRQKLIEDNKHLEYPTDGKYRRDRAWSVGFNAGAKHCNEHAVYAKTVIEAEDGE